MDITRCLYVSEVEFGSTFQGTADSYSDKDIMILLQQPLVDVVFRNNEKASHHSEIARYYSVERFISLTFKGSFDNVLLLCAQLSQAQNTGFNEYVLSEFYKQEVFNDYLKANFKTLCMSLIGQMNKITSKDEINGKELLKFLNFEAHLHNLIEFAKGERAITYINFPINQEVQPFIKYKRLTFDELEEEDVFGALGVRCYSEIKEAHEQKAKHIVNVIKSLDKFEKEKNRMKNIENSIKGKCVDYIVRNNFGVV